MEHPIPKRRESGGGDVMETFTPYLGALAATLTALSYFPQVRKAWPRGSTDDLSLKTLAVLTAGLLLWVTYGVLRGDWTLAAANIVAAALSGCVLSFKIRDSLT